MPHVRSRADLFRSLDHVIILRHSDGRIDRINCYDNKDRLLHTSMAIWQKTESNELQRLYRVEGFLAPEIIAETKYVTIQNPQSSARTQKSLLALRNAYSFDTEIFGTGTIKYVNWTCYDTLALPDLYPQLWIDGAFCLPLETSLTNWAGQFLSGKGNAAVTLSQPFSGTGLFVNRWYATDQYYNLTLYMDLPFLKSFKIGWLSGSVAADYTTIVSGLYTKTI